MIVYPNGEVYDEPQSYMSDDFIVTEAEMCLNDIVELVYQNFGEGRQAASVMAELIEAHGLA